MGIVIQISKLDTDKQIKAMLRQNELESGMAQKRKHQVHKDKSVYSRKLKHKLKEIW